MSRLKLIVQGTDEYDNKYDDDLDDHNDDHEDNGDDKNKIATTPANFQARTSRFCVVVDLDNTHR